MFKKVKKINEHVTSSETFGRASQKSKVSRWALPIPFTPISLPQARCAACVTVVTGARKTAPYGQGVSRTILIPSSATKILSVIRFSRQHAVARLVLSAGKKSQKYLRGE